MRQAKGPEFIRFFRPILEALSKSGGSGTPSEIIDRTIEMAKVSESEQEAVNKNGQSRVKNQSTGHVSTLYGRATWVLPREVSGVLPIKARPSISRILMR